MNAMLRGLSLLLLALMLPALALGAEGYPTKPIRLIVPFPPGGPADVLARVVGDKIGARMGKQMPAVLGGQVQLMFAGAPAVLQHVKAGKLKALGVASPKRMAAAPDLPTIAESGLPGFDVTSWYSIVAPSGTPPEVIGRLQSKISKALREPDVREKLAGLGAAPIGNSPAEFGAMIRSETAKRSKIVKEAGITAE